MRTGSIRDVIDVLKSLNFLSKSKNLSFREKRMLDRAKFLVVSEISEVLEEEGDVIDDKVEKALERCLVNRVRLLEKVKTAKTSKKTAKVAPAPTTKDAKDVRAKKAPSAVKATKVSKVAKVKKTTTRSARAS